MSEGERVAAAQAEIAAIQKRYGVQLIVQAVVKRIDDGGVIVQPVVVVQPVAEWKRDETVG